MIMKAAFGSLHNHTRYIYDVVMDANMAVGNQVESYKNCYAVAAYPRLV